MLIRCGQFGNPFVHVDENFYLLVGDRMLHGAVPYVDIWDRKPIGLFLLYAAIRLLGGTGIVQYQVVASLFVAATAVLIVRLARPIASLPAATVAALLYMLMLGTAGGMGGQSPVFYNLPVAGAALLVMRCWLDPAPDPARLRRRGLWAMLLLGLAMQIKYSPVFEGVFFGLALLLRGWTLHRAPARLAADATLWAGTALAPTALAWGVYAAMGEGQAFVYANFLSIGARATTSAADALRNLAHSWAALHLPIVCVLLSATLAPWRDRAQGPRAFGFVMAWLGAALLGYLLFGTYFNHYALPLMVPIAVAAAPLFGVARARIGPVAAGVMLTLGGIAYVAIARHDEARRGGRTAADAMVAAIAPRLGQGCLFVYDGDAILYHLTHACIPTRYAFPPHLNLLRESGAIGADPLAEIRRVFATRPAVVVDRQGEQNREENPAAEALVQRLLRPDYREVARIPTRRTVTVVYARVTG